MRDALGEDNLIKKLLGVFVAGHVLVVAIAMFLIVFYFIRFDIDFYVYVQAFTYWSFSNINPAIPLRGFHIFNDHFDPLLILPALISKVINPVIVGAFSDYAFILMTVAFFYILYKKKELTLSVSAFAIIYTLLGCATLNVLWYPTHPSSWSILPITLLCWFFHKRQNKGIILSYLLLLTCKEEFITVGFMLFLATLYRREYRLGGIVGFITLVWALFIFKLRFIIWPYEHIAYGKELLEWFFSKPLENILDFYNVPLILYYHIFVFSPVLLLVWMVLKKRAIWKEIDFSPLFFVLPIYAIRIMPGTWISRHGGFFSDHYLISISSFVLMFFIVNFPKLVLSSRFLTIWFLFMIFSNVPMPNTWAEGWWLKYVGKKADSNNFQEAVIFDNKKSYFEQMKMYEERRKEVVKALVLAKAFVKMNPNNNVFGDKVFITHLSDNPNNFRASMWAYYNNIEERKRMLEEFRNQKWIHQIWDNVDFVNKNADHELVFLENGYLPELEDFFRKNGRVLFEGKYIFLAERSLKK